MTGEKDLEALLAAMHPVQRGGEYVYAVWPEGRPLVPGIEAAVREAEGLTVVLPRAVADREGLGYDFVGAWITLEVHSALEAVGLTAEAFAVSPATGLKAEGEPVEVRVLRGLFESKEYLPEFSLVAVLDGEVVGHVISTRGWVGDHGLLGLGPLAVTPRHQRHGVGSALMKETIHRANAAGESGIALLGSPEYYSRFGFVPATSLGVLPPDEAWGDYFQLLPLALWPGGVHGTFRYAEPFALT